jgi:hypothetical protein
LPVLSATVWASSTEVGSPSTFTTRKKRMEA